MLNTQVKNLTAASVALAALLALGACGKKVDDTGSVPTPSPRTDSTDSTGSSSGTSSGSTSGSSGMGSGSAGSSMPAPMSPASSSRY